MKKIETREELQIKVNQLEAKISEIENTESRSRAWLENSPVCTKIIDLDFNLHYMSNAGISALQIDDILEYYGEPYPFSFFPPAYNKAMNENMRRAKETGETIIQEGQVLDIKGNPLWFEASITPVYNEQDELDHLLVISIDTWARKQAEDEVLTSEEKYRSIYNNSPSGIFRSNPEGEILSANQAFLEIYNFKSLEELDKTAVQDFYVNIEDRNLILEILKKEGIVKNHVTKARKRDNSEIYVKTNYTATKDEKGNILFIDGVLEDITQQIEAEERLKESQEKYRTMIESSNDIIWMLDLKGNFTFVNAHAEKATGYLQENIIGKSFMPIVLKEELPFLNEVFEKTMSGETISYEMSLKTVYGNTIILSVNTAPLYADGEVNAMFSFARDITERKEAEDLLKESETRFKALHNASFGGIAIHDKGIIKECNQGLSDITGYSIEELIGTDGLRCIAEDSRKIVKQNIITSYEKAYEVIGLRKNGEEFPLKLEAKMIPYQGKMMRVVEFRDVTEEKQAEKALIESEDRFRKLIENMPSGVAIYKAVDKGSDFEFIDINKKAEEITNSSNKEIIGRTLLEKFPNMKNGSFHESLKKISKDSISIHLPPFFYQDEQRQGWRENNIYKLASGEIVAIFKDVTDIKEAEEQLKKQNIELQEAKEEAEESNERFNLAMTAAKDGLYDWNLLTNEIYYSPGWKSMLGYGDDELPNELSVWEQLIGAEDAERSWKMQEELLNKQRDRFELEFKMKHKDGHWVDILSRAEMMFDENDIAIRMIGTHVDISERKEAEKALIEKEIRFRAFMNASKDLTFIKDEDFRYLFANEETARLFNTTITEIIGKTDKELSEQIDIAPCQSSDIRALDSKEQFTIEEQLGERIFEVTKLPLKLPDDKKGIGGIMKDITERVAAEKSLKESEEYFRALIENSSDVVSILNDKGIITYESPSHEKVLGYEKGELIGENVFGLVHSDDRERISFQFSKLLENPNGIKQVSFRFLRKDGTWIYIEGTGTNLLDSPKINGVVVNYRDVSEQKEVDEKLAKEKKIFEDLFNNINSGVAIYKVLNDGELGSDYIIENFNNKSTKLAGRTREEVIGTSLSDLRPGIDEFGLIQEFRKVWKTGVGKLYSFKAHNGENYSSYYENRIFRLPNKNIVSIYDDVTERVQAEEKIRVAERNLKNTFDLSPSIIAKADMIKGSFTQVNIAVTKILGYTIEEFTSKPYMEFVHPDDRQSTIDIATEQLKGNDVTFFENRYLCKDGSYKWMAWHGTKPDKNAMVTTIGSDINERKSVEEEIIKTKQFYEKVLEGVQDGIWVSDENDTVFYANSAIERVSGVSIEKIKGKNILKDFPEETNAELINYYLQAKKEKKPVWYDIKIKTLSYNDSWQNGWLIPQYQNDVFNGIICTVRDVTERKEAEGSVRRLSTAVEQSPTMIVITDLVGTLDYVNPTFSELTGYSGGEAIGKKSNILKSGAQTDAFYKEMWETIESGEVWRGQFHNKKKNGELFWEAASISAILNEQGDVINYIKVGEDITQQKKTEEKLKIALEKAMESDRLKSAFLSNMSHEIRTPMNGILGFINLLNKPNLSKNQIDEYTGIIEKSSKRLLTTINDIIDISKIEAGEMLISKTETCISNLLEELQSFHANEARQKGLTLRLESAPFTSEISIFTDGQKLHGILTNLIKNALKYTEKGAVDFGYSTNENFIEFYVKDTGVGIPKDRMDAIFNRFEQADIEDTRAFEGSGLGLTISKAFVEMLGGRLSVTSVEGKGSTFTFTLPYTKNEYVELEPQVNTIVNNIEKIESLENLSLLIVEDDEVSSELLKTILEDTFLSISQVSNGLEAVEFCKSNLEVDLVLMDIKMPVMGGYEATRQIRTFNKDLIIIAQTAYSMVGDHKESIKAGCTDYISKPIDTELLFEIITKHLKFKNT